jgi:hypothetical protein
MTFRRRGYRWSLLSAAVATAAARSVNARAKHGNDREEIVGELPILVAAMRSVVKVAFAVVLRGGEIQRWCVHDDVRSATTENELETIVCEAAQAVTVGNIHRAYSSRKRGVQKGAKATPVAEV